jgi:hydrogenase/urease accessory protein HupE
MGCEMTPVARLIIGLMMLFNSAVSANAHALEPGYLDLRQLTPETWQVFWRKPDVQGAPMAIKAQLPPGCTPDQGAASTFDGAAWVSGWVADCSGGLVGSEITIDGLSAQRTDVLLRLHPLDHSPTTVRLTPDAPAHFVLAEPTTGEVFLSYLVLGFEHILEGLDHLLFVFALMVLIRDFWRLVTAITAFTIAHSITLALAALGHLSVPGPPVEAIIALSIVFLAIEILKHEDGQIRLSERFPWIVSFSFGLLHGLGFAGALTEIGLPQGDIPAALLAFNLGVEAGQLFFVGAVLSLFWLASMIFPDPVRSFRKAHSSMSNVTGYGIGGLATFWLVQRVAGF